MKDRYNSIITNLAYQEHLRKIEASEKERLFCKHEIDHFFDVARIAYILSLEMRIEVSKEVIYATALLHDIGKWEEIQLGIPHEESSARLCVEILKACHYTMKEIDMIQEAILSHRNAQVKDEETLGGILYKADKLSRKCFQCKQEVNCNWKQKKKNFKMRY